MGAIGLRRAYDPAGEGEGARVLVDRIWPRGIARARLDIDEWVKDLAPSDDLRRWFGHDPARWSEFRRRYLAELAANPAPFEALLARARSGPLTLLYAARDQEHNNAVVLRQAIEERLKE
ncbi:DUF488 domain-containing protein [Amaricoccus sp.]|uniref:DUF488 domain-containing protein n=1 Tax=Amaricoccus sp. TaxID=1872485 RepID=UPI001B5B8D60|nr:DUF488 family protein [Amaricoccus sp.]MBP7242182.1 DUF488 family protein [Amaricoccus sp.]